MTTGLVMGTVMTQTIFWIVTMMVETAVDILLTLIFVPTVDAISMKLVLPVLIH